MLFLGYLEIAVGLFGAVAVTTLWALACRGVRLGLYTWEQLDGMRFFDAVRLVLASK